MAGRAYLGMVLVYDDKRDLEDARRKIVNAGIKNGLKWIEPNLNISVEMNDGRYIVKEYETKEEMDDLLFLSGAEWLSGVRPKKTHEYKEKELIEYMEKYWDRIGDSNVVLCSVPFPPDKYLNRYGIGYDRKRPWLKTHQEGGNCVYIYKENKIKPAIIIDFWSVSRYIEDSDPPLSNAVEDFLVDLMREIVKATEPEYAYFDYDEYEPLEDDPVCEGNVELKRIPSGYDGKMHVVLGNIAYIRKELIERAVKGDIKRAYHPFYREFYDVHVEDIGTHYLMYPDRYLNPGGVLVYETGDKDEYEKFAYFEEKEVVVKYVCGDLSRGIVLGVKPNKKDMRREDVERVLDEWVKKQNVRIRKLDYLSKH